MNPNFQRTGFDLDGHCAVPRFISELVHGVGVARKRYEVVQWIRGCEPGNVHRLVRRFVDDKHERIENIVVERGGQLLVKEVALPLRRKVQCRGIYTHLMFHFEVDEFMHTEQERYRVEHEYDRYPDAGNKTYYSGPLVGLTGRCAGSYENAGLVALEVIRPATMSSTALREPELQLTRLNKYPPPCQMAHTSLTRRNALMVGRSITCDPHNP